MTRGKFHNSRTARSRSRETLDALRSSEVSRLRLQADRSCSRRSGLTLFEVLLALAIFVGSMVAIGRMVSNALRGAVQGRMQSQAVLRCQSKLAEVVAGIVPFQAVPEMAYADDSTWKWSLTLAPASQENLYLAEVTVSHESRDPIGQVSYKLRRMVRDPAQFTAALEAEAEKALQKASSSSSSSSSSSGASGGGS